MSRWRLRRTRPLWNLNAVLVLPNHPCRGTPSKLDSNLRSTKTILHPMSTAEQEVFSTRKQHEALRTRSVRRASGLLETAQHLRTTRGQGRDWRKVRGTVTGPVITRRKWPL